MSDSHTIYNATFEIDFSNTLLASDFEREAGGYFTRRLLPVVEEVFDQTVGDDEVISIDLLEIDLGAMNEADFHDEMESRLKSQLQEALQRLITTPGHETNVIKRSKQQSDQQQLYTYLQRGYLPWNAQPSSGQTMEQIFIDTLQSEPESLTAFLRQNLAASIVLLRIVRQFSHHTLLKLVEGLAGNRYPFLPFFVKDLLKIEILRTRLQFSEAKFKTQLWVALLGVLLARGSGLSDSIVLLENILKRFCDTAVPSQDPGVLLADLVRPGNMARVSPELAKVLQRSSVPLPVLFQSELHPDSSDLQKRLTQMLIQGDVDELLSVWAILLDQHRRLFEHALRLYGRFASVRKIWVQRFGDPMLRDVVVVLEPVDYSFVHNLVDQPQLFQQIPMNPPETEDALKVQLWEFTLSYLLVERGSTFNKRSYLEGLLHQMAAHHNLHYFDLLESLTHTLERLDANHTHNPVWLLLQDLRQEHPKHSNPKRHDTGLAQQDLTEHSTHERDTSQAQEGHPKTEESQTQEKYIQRRVIKALEEGDIQQLQPLWPLLLLQYRNFLEKNLRTYGQRAHLRQKWAHGMSESMFYKLILFLEPQAAELVTQIVEHPQIFYQPADVVSQRNWVSAENVVSEAPESQGNIHDFKNLLRLFTLTYLLIERGGNFNKRVFMKSVIQQIAAHRNLDCDELLTAIVQTLKYLQLSPDFQNMLQHLFKELQSSDNTNLSASSHKNLSSSTHTELQPSPHKNLSSSTHTELQPSSISNAQQSSEETLYQTIRIFLLKQITPATSPLLDWTHQDFIRKLEQLLNHHPQSFQRLLSEWETGTVPWEAIIQQLPVVLLKPIIFALLAKREGTAQANESSAFVIALNTFAAQAGNSPHYFARLLELLLRHETIDFEVLVQESQSAAESIQSTESTKPTESIELAESIQSAETETHAQASNTKVSPTHKTLETPGASPSAGGYSFGQQEVQEESPLEEIYISNAGMVLAHPYLSRLFEMLELMEAHQFKDSDHAERAIHLLQYMTDASTHTPEYQLVLNKLLCGVTSEKPICSGIEITDGEQEIVEGLIQGMIANWSAIGNTSVEGFREAFLQRTGRLLLKSDHWVLQVDPKPFDMLLDRLPWSITTIKYSWMPRRLQVEWR